VHSLGRSREAFRTAAIREDDQTASTRGGQMVEHREWGRRGAQQA
jgi:hypothetical protein